MKTRITRARIEAAAPRIVSGKPREVTMWDDAVTGFGLRVAPSGSKAFILAYRPRNGGPARRVTIAPWPKLTVERARDRAKEIVAAVALGADPAGERAGERQATREHAAAVAMAEREGRAAP